MWYDDNPDGSTWAALWFGYTLCGTCSGIRRDEEMCPACGGDPVDFDPAPLRVRLEDGREIAVARNASCGAEGRYEDWIYLQMLQREWERPAPDFEHFLSMESTARPSARAALALLFWSYFETRIERLLRAGMKSLPPRVLDNLLERYSSIGSRLDRLYRIAFATTYQADLSDLGYPEIGTFLAELQKRRNEFVHGQPQALDDEIVSRLVSLLKTEHESWIAVFNRRATAIPRYAAT